MRASSTFSDYRQFFGAWVSDPLRVASVIPSGRALGTLITEGIEAEAGLVIELGAGTGVFTRALIERGIPQHRLVLIEQGAGFAELLRSRFPEADVVRMDAVRLRHLRWQANGKAIAVVSGLPLLSMPPPKVMAILAGAFSHLRADGSFRQFTYGPRCPVSTEILDRLGLRARSAGWVFGNVPPAQVFHITRRDDAPAIERPSKWESLS